jgi:hypothetical protein
MRIFKLPNYRIYLGTFAVGKLYMEHMLELWKF